MKIAFDAKRAFLNRRGLGNYSRDTIRILASHCSDNQYVLYTTSMGGNTLFTVPSTCEVVLPEGFWKRSFPALWRTFNLGKDAARRQADIFHGLSHELPVGIEKTRVRSVVTMHDLIFLRYPQLYPAIDRVMYKHKYLRSCRVADVVVAVSEQTRRDLVEMGGVEKEKIRVVYQGCHPMFRAKASEEEIRSVRQKYELPLDFVLTVGAFEARKNQKLILEAMCQCRTDFPLVLVGHNAGEENALRQFVEQHDLQKRVMFLTGVPSTDLRVMYQSATVFVYPSVFEGFGIPVLEAVVSGTPVIAATGSCLEESGGPDSCYVSPQDASELAAQLDRLLTDEQTRAVMARRGLEFSQKFSEDHIAQQLMLIYQSLLTN